MKHLLLITAFILASFATQAQTVYEVSTFAGSGALGSKDALGTAASFFRPRGVCSDASGNIYVVDRDNHKIRKITPSGVVTTFAGSGAKGSADGIGTAASFNYPNGICSDTAGNIYVADDSNHKIRKITTGGAVSTLAGSGTVGSSDGSGTAASFNGPIGVCSDIAGNIYVADELNHKIRKITTGGAVSTLAGSGTVGSADGTGTAASFYYPSGVCSDAAGNIYVADVSNHKIRKITTGGAVSTLAGSGTRGSADGMGTTASFNYPEGVCSDASGNIYVADHENDKIRKITPAGVVTTLAGSGANGSADAIGTAASFSSPMGVCSDASGNIYVGDAYNNKIRKIQAKTQAPPTVNYLNLPGSLCIGSAVKAQPTVGGSIPQLALTLDSTILVNTPKKVTKNNHAVFVVDGTDKIFRYGFDGTLQYTYNTGAVVSNIMAIAADDNDSVYVATGDDMIHVFDPSGGNKSIQVAYLGGNTNITSMAFAPTNYIPENLIVLDTIGSDFVGVNPHNADQFTNGNYWGNPTLIQPSNNFTSIAFDNFSYPEKRQLLADPRQGKLLACKLYDVNATNYDIKPLVDTALTKNLALDFISVDTTYNFITTSSSKTGALTLITTSGSGSKTVSNMDFSFAAIPHKNPIAMIFAKAPGVIGQFWVIDKGKNKIIRAAISSFQINPELPQGLIYNQISGVIQGTPTAIVATQTYTITVKDFLGASITKTITFAVTPTGNISNTPGTATSLNEQADGLAITYTDPNNCNKMIAIADSIGGTSLGTTQVTQTVYPTIASFSSGKFVGRKTEINTQDPKAKAQLKLYFTYQDIVNYNLFNGTGVDLSNDTTGGSMQVGVLQLHTDSTGHIKQIKHNPITAKWISTEKNWRVDFPVQKFSTFYVAQSADITAFDCANSGKDSVVTGNNYYVWHGDSIFTSGTFKDTLINKADCDSITTLKLTLNTVGIATTPELEKGLSIYPNPSNGTLNVNINNANALVKSLSIYNVLGVEVYNNTQVQQNNKIDLTAVAKGVYFITLKTTTETVTRKIFIE